MEETPQNDADIMCTARSYKLPSSHRGIPQLSLTIPRLQLDSIKLLESSSSSSSSSRSSSERNVMESQISIENEELKNDDENINRREYIEMERIIEFQKRLIFQLSETRNELEENFVIIQNTQKKLIHSISYLKNIILGSPGGSPSISSSSPSSPASKSSSKFPELISTDVFLNLILQIETFLNYSTKRSIKRHLTDTTTTIDDELRRSSIVMMEDSSI